MKVGRRPCFPAGRAACAASSERRFFWLPTPRWPRRWAVRCRLSHGQSFVSSRAAWSGPQAQRRRRGSAGRNGVKQQSACGVDRSIHISVSIDAFPTGRPLKRRSRHGRNREMIARDRHNGCSPSKRPGTKWAMPIPNPKLTNRDPLIQIHCEETLVLWRDAEGRTGVPLDEG